MNDRVGHPMFGIYQAKALTALPLLVILLFSYALSASASDTTLRISYPAVDDQNSRDFDAYFLMQLKLALDKSGQRYQMVPFRTPTFVESRSEFYLRKNRYDLHWLHTNPKREAALIPVRVPLFKGLIGWRIFFIRKGDQARFAKITQLQELRSLTLGQGHDWPDTPLLRANQFKIETSTQWSSLFQMLEQGRFDFFPRSIIEIWREEKIFSELDIEIEQSLALQYRAAYYFFVSPQNQSLADAVEKGLQIAIADGSFDSNFYNFFGEIIAKARLNDRRVFQLDNPLVSYPNKPELWFAPLQDKTRGSASSNTHQRPPSTALP